MTRSIEKPYPARNPFPYQGTLSVEGTRIERGDDDPGPKLPTLRLEPITRVEELAATYLQRIASPDVTQGLGACLHGDHGSGKTHSIRYVMEWIDRGPSSGATPSGSAPLQIYVKAEGQDFVGIYRAIMAQVPFDVLRQVGMSFLGEMIGKQLGKNLSDKKAGAQATEALQREPTRISRMLGDYLVEQGALEDRVSTEIKGISGGIQDFQRALPFLLSDDPTLSATAYNWLKGLPTSAEDNRRLGVSCPITQAEVTMASLRLLASFFGRARRPFILYLDQFEKLVLAGSPESAVENIGRLHSLVEIVPRERGMIVLCGNDEAWRALPRDLKARFADHVIEFPVLSPTEATDLIRLYLTPATERFEPGRPDADLFPFTADGVRAMLRSGAGNIRRLLQISALVFEKAFPSQRLVDGAAVAEALQDTRRFHFNEKTVSREIAEALRQRGLRFVEEYRSGKIAIDFAVLDPHGRPRLLIELKEALFHPHEVRHALEGLSLVEAASHMETPAQVALVVIGYASPEVTEEIRKIVPDLVVYDPETFPARFGALLDRTTSAATGGHLSSQERQELERQLADVRGRLDQLLATRERESRVTEERLAALLGHQAVERDGDRRQKTRQAWAEERRKIEERIRAARAERRKRALEELEELRTKAVLSQVRRAWMWGMVCVLPGIFALFLATPYWLDAIRGAILSRTQLANNLMGMSTLYATGALVFAGFSLLRAYNLIGAPAARDLFDRVSSLDMLDRLARAFIATKNLYLNRLMANPHFRYAWAIDRELEIGNGRLLKALMTEPSSLVRSALARSMGPEIPNEPIRQLAQKVPEIVYLVETLAISGTTLSQPLSPALVALAEIVRTTVFAIADKVSMPMALLLGELPHGPAVQILAPAFEDGLDRRPPATEDLVRISEARVEGALKILTPFDEGGLGSFDDLQCIERVDRYYLFFRQLLFMMEREVLGATDVVRPEAART